MDIQLKIWLALTAVILLARGLTISTTHVNLLNGYPYERYYWNGPVWFKWVPTGWLALSLFLYLLK